MVVGGEDVHALKDAAVLDDGLVAGVDAQNVLEALLQEEHLQGKRPSLDVLVVVAQVGVVHHGLHEGFPTVMLGEHLGQGGFTATDISCYNDVHGSVKNRLFYKLQR